MDWLNPSRAPRLLKKTYTRRTRTYTRWQKGETRSRNRENEIKISIQGRSKSQG